MPACRQETGRAWLRLSVDGKAVRAVTLFAAHDGGVFLVLGLYAVSHEATLGQTVRHVLASLQLAS